MAIIYEYRRGKLVCDVAAIGAFQLEAAALIQSGALSDEEGDLLIDLTDDLIDSLFVDVEFHVESLQ